MRGEGMAKSLAALIFAVCCRPRSAHGEGDIKCTQPVIDRGESSLVYSAVIRTAFAAVILSLTAFMSVAANAQSLPATHEERVEAVNRNTIGLVSGGVGGTYIKIAADLQAVLDSEKSEDGIRVLPVVGKGSVQNIADLLYMRGVDIAIVQSDVLAFLKSDPAFPNLENRIGYITKLYNEEFHLIARRDITDISQLEGKTVNFGPEGSGTAMTAKVVFESLGQSVNATNLNYQDALDQVKSGKIDAMVYVAGKPASIFSSISPEDGLHIVPVSYDAKLQNSYLPASISTQDYPGLVAAGNDVDTIAVGAVMAVFNWKQGTGRYYSTKLFIETFLSRFPELLQEPRHPKWSEVNLAAQLPGWQRYSVAEEWLKQNPVQAASISGKQDRRVAELVAAFEKFLSQQPQAGLVSESERQALFKRFLEWSQREGATANN